MTEARPEHRLLPSRAAAMLLAAGLLWSGASGASHAAEPAESAKEAVASRSAATPPQRPEAFSLCAPCHSTSEGGGHGYGPNLRGVLGRQAGTAEGFAYSSAMKKAGHRWTREKLLEYLEDPWSVVPNTPMVIEGLVWPNAAQRQEIVRYLEALASSQTP